MWNEVIWKVHMPCRSEDEKNIVACPACGQYEKKLGLTFEHTYFHCSEVKAAGYTFLCYIKRHRRDLLKAGWREAMLDDKVFVGALNFLGEVVQARAHDEILMRGMYIVRDTDKMPISGSAPVLLLNTVARSGDSGKGNRGGVRPAKRSSAEYSGKGTVAKSGVFGKGNRGRVRRGRRRS